MSLWNLPPATILIGGILEEYLCSEFVDIIDNELYLEQGVYK